MREEYFPAIHMGQTRVGRVTGLALLERQNEFTGDDVVREFIWHVDWSGTPTEPAHIEIHVDDEAIARKFEVFKADIKRLGAYEEVAVRS